MKFENVKKILIFKLCCLGDIVFITPAIMALKQNFPGAEIALISSSWVEGISGIIPGIDKTKIFDPPYKGNIFTNVSAAWKLISMLRKDNFDLVILGHRTNYFGLILKLAKIRYRLGFSQTKFLTHTADFDDKIKETRRYLKILSENGIIVKNEIPRLLIGKDILITSTIVDLKKNKKIIGIFPFGGVNPGTDMDIKKWGMENYKRLIKIITGQYPETEILLFEGKLESEKISAEELLMCGDIQVRQISPDLISICNVFISGDTGPLHIAAALDVSTLSLFGPSDPRLVAPENSSESKAKHKYIWLQPECSPCYTTETAIRKKRSINWKGNIFVCHTGTNECIKNISVEEVFNELKCFL
jgi:heptosyltransferase-2/heptosyltransferase-3